jgi:RHS repeat-associated protein
MSHFSISRLIRSFLIVLPLAASAMAQNIQNPQSAVDNTMRSNLHVDQSTGAMQLQIPLGIYRGRGQASLPISLNYSSKLWSIKYLSTLTCGTTEGNEPVSSYRAEYSKGSASGWTSTLGWFLPDPDRPDETYDTSGHVAQAPNNSYRIMRKFVTLPDGSQHELRLDDLRHSFGANPSGTYYAVDGSRLKWDWTDPFNNILYLPDGSRIVMTNGSRQYMDRNGNYLSLPSNSSTWSDTLGRPFGVPIPGSAPAVAGQSVYTLPGGLSYTLVWSNLANALTVNQALEYQGDAPTQDCSMSTAQAGTLFSTIDSQHKMLRQTIFNPVVLSQIVLPNGTSYTFTYNVYGEIDKIIYPTGGTETFTYGPLTPLGGQLDDGTFSQANRGVYSRVISDGVTSQIWYYNSGGNYYETGVDPGTDMRWVKSPDGTITKTWYYVSRNNQIKYGFDDARTGMVREERVYDSTNTTMLRRTVYQLFRDLTDFGAYTATRNARVLRKIDIILDTGTDSALASATEMDYDSDLNVISTRQYDYVSISQTTARSADYSSIPNGTLLRTDETDYLTGDANYRARNLLSLPTATRIKNGAGTIMAQSFINYDESGYPVLGYGAITNWSDPGSARGNPTTAGVWENISGTYLQTHAQYDQSGSVRNTWDARGNLSQVEYSSSYAYAYPTLTRSAVPDPSGAYGSTTALVATSAYDFNTGLVTSTTDANGQTTTYAYNDSLLRLTQVNLPDGGRTTRTYVDAHQCGPYVETRTLLDSSGRETDSYQFLDALGRPKRAFSYDNQDTTNPYLTVDTQYDSMGRAYRVSNPYRSSGCTATVNPSGRWTTSAFDPLGRVTSVTTPDSAVVASSYSGNTVTVTDQAGKARKSVTDALGRLAQVYEDPNGLNYLTSYTYDVLGNLRRVDQGSQQRFFMYDSLSRLIRAKNPEQAAGSIASNITDTVTGNSQWSMAYDYDNNGNLNARLDARNITTTYAYDALNRNYSITYDGTPAVYRYYDSATNGRGRLYWDQAVGVSANAIDAYDSMGRPSQAHQVFWVNGTWGNYFNVARTYDKAGHVLTQTNPSGRTVNYGYDIAGRLNNYTGNLGDGVSRTYSTGVSYTEFGGLQQEQFGTQTALYHKLHYNVRGQLNDIRLSSVAWATDQWNWNRGAIVNYYATADLTCQTNECRANSGTDNNGNLLQSQHWIPANDSMTSYNWTEDRYYPNAYDSLNRLNSVAEYHGSSASGLSGQDFAQVYDYDRWGNRTINQNQTSASVPHPNYTADTSNNRLIAPAGYNYGYDYAGNQTNDNYTGQGQRTYDAENRMTQAWANSQWQTYTYDAGGRRIKRNVNGVETWQVYGMDGELLGEYAAGAAPFVATTEYGYRGGELLVTITNGDTQRLTRFVTNLYYGAKQRDPSSTELQDGINQLAAAGATSQAQLLTVASQLARSLFTGTNYELNAPARSDLQYTGDLYYAYLQRGPDDGGLGFWANQAAGGATNRSNVCDAFQASGEFQTLVANLYGTATSDDERTEHFVNNFYRGAYGRDANSTEIQQQRDALNAAAAQNQSAVQSQAETFGRSLFAGQVNDSSISDTQFATNLYEAFLQRGPDAGGLGWWSPQATLGQGRQNVLGAFATCPAFRDLSATLYREANWLVSDHLGTPRMIANKSGALASMKRHDYLPFGEELSAGTGGRTTTQGYSGDSVRQKFTSKERDNETGLDYFLARYYSNMQGRFTGVDPITITEKRQHDPQQINLYVFVRNNPLKFVDSDGCEIKYANEEARQKLQPLVEQGDKESSTFKTGFDEFRGQGKPDITLSVGSLPGGIIGQTTTKVEGESDDNGTVISATATSTTVAIDYDKTAQGGFDQVDNLGHEVVGHAVQNNKDPKKYAQGLADDKKNHNKKNENTREDKARKVEGQITRERQDFRKKAEEDAKKPKPKDSDPRKRN